MSGEHAIVVQNDRVRLTRPVSFAEQGGVRPLRSWTTGEPSSQLLRCGLSSSSALAASRLNFDQLDDAAAVGLGAGRLDETRGPWPFLTLVESGLGLWSARGSAKALAMGGPFQGQVGADLEE